MPASNVLNESDNASETFLKASRDFWRGLLREGSLIAMVVYRVSSNVSFPRISVVYMLFNS